MEIGQQGENKPSDLPEAGVREASETFEYIKKCEKDYKVIICLF